MSSSCFVTIEVESTILGEGIRQIVVPINRILKIVPMRDSGLNEVHLASFDNSDNEILRTKGSFSDIFNSAMFVSPMTQYAYNQDLTASVD
jgi:hypothetical protein|tara:strand:- start:8180 stop:8452 length:273 start_codon:yes stop_codon:yes gene_type:complete